MGVQGMKSSHWYLVLPTIRRRLQVPLWPFRVRWCVSVLGCHTYLRGDSMESNPPCYSGQKHMLAWKCHQSEIFSNYEVTRGGLSSWRGTKMAFAEPVFCWSWPFFICCFNWSCKAVYLDWCYMAYKWICMNKKWSLGIHIHFFYVLCRSLSLQ